jgi:hypothetical protein
MRMKILFLIALAIIAMQELVFCNEANTDSDLQFNSSIPLATQEGTLNATSAMISWLVSTSLDGQLADSIPLKEQVNRDLGSIIDGDLATFENPFSEDELNPENWEEQIEVSFSQIIEVNPDVSGGADESVFEEPYLEYSMIAKVDNNIISLTGSGSDAKGSANSNFSWSP